jgi:hypothetical protein
MVVRKVPQHSMLSSIQDTYIPRAAGEPVCRSSDPEHAVQAHSSTQEAVARALPGSLPHLNG